VVLKHVLVLIGYDIETFNKFGHRSSEYPRRSQAFPFCGNLSERGVHVTVKSVGNGDQNDRLLRVTSWWTPYIRSLKIIPSFRSYDAIVAWGTSGLFLAAICSVSSRISKRIAIIVFSNDTPITGSLRTRLRSALHRRALDSAGRVIFMTHEQVQEAGERSARKTNIVHLPVGVDIDFFVPKDIQRVASIRPEIEELCHKRYIVVSGDQLRDEESIAKCVEILQIGLVRLTQNRSLENFWRSWAQTHPAIDPLLCIADLSSSEVRYVYQHTVCLLSLVDNSWQPAGWSTITEAMACGVPVVANRGLTTTELKSYVQSDEALPFIEIGERDPKHAAHAIAALLADPCAYHRMGKLARKFVEANLDIHETSKHAFRILERVAAGRNRGKACQL
jgi:glycosyltransferase involved in cell wall biosynthesis